MKCEELKIFLVDDDQIFRFLCKKMLTKYVSPEQVIEFVNGKDALENIDKTPNVILLDINMPVLDGWQFLEELQKKSFCPNLRIVIISSSIDPIDFEKFKKFPFLHSFINKPLKQVEIEDLLLSW